MDAVGIVDVVRPVAPGVRAGVLTLALDEPTSTQGARSPSHSALQ